MRNRKLWLLVVLLLVMIPLHAQDDDPEATPEATPEVTPEMTPEATGDCPEIVETAIDLTQTECESTGFNEVCYGHLVLDAQLSQTQSAQQSIFNSPGDIIDVIRVQSLQLSAMDVQTGQWGVVLLEVGANLVQPPEQDNTDGDTSAEATPEATAEEEEEDNVQILLFGDVQIEDANRFIQVTVDETLNIRRRPSTNAEVISVLDAGEIVTANGRLEDNSWLRIRVLDEEGGTGWISTGSISTEGDIEELRAFTEEEAQSDIPDELALYGPMQAFFLETGNDDAPCAEAPNSGILLQTPEGVASIRIWMDEVVVEMNDTAFIQAQPDGNLTVNVLEGSATVEAMGETSTALAGQSIDVNLDEDLSPSSTPSDPRPIDDEDLQALPTQLLDDEVIIPEPLEVDSGLPVDGSWRWAWGVDVLVCDDGTEVPFLSTGGTFPIVVQSDSLMVNTRSYRQTTPGVYRATYSDINGNLYQDTLQVVSTDQIIGEQIIDYVSPVCTLTVPFTINLVNGGG